MNIFLHTYGDITCRHGWGVDEESAVFSRVYYVFGGECYYVCDGEKTKLESGHIYIFPQNKPYKIYHNPASPFQTMWFHITTSSSVNAFCDIDITPSGEAILQLIRQEMKVDDRKVIELLLGAFLQKAMGNQFYVSSEIAKVLEYIHGEVFMRGEKISLSDLASVAGFEKSYFITRFKKELEVTPMQYVINLKLEKIAECIETGTITNLALQYGFTDYKNFSNLFKKKYKLSPKKFLALRKTQI